MASHKMIPFRRKRTGYTNYKVRLSLLKSRKPRVVVRKSQQYIIAQLVQYKADGDHVLVTVSSKELGKHGWNYSKKNVPAAYLTGLLFGKKALAHAKDGIVDIGSFVSKKESRLYAVVKGAIDAGFNVPVSEDILPSEDRVTGSHISSFASSLDKDAAAKQFSGYTKQNADPTKMPEAFGKVKTALMK
ncbi:MAG: 50S ribosomal protein L18 [Nanoarchaeota archaeon]